MAINVPWCQTCPCSCFDRICLITVIDSWAKLSLSALWRIRKATFDYLRESSDGCVDFVADGTEVTVEDVASGMRQSSCDGRTDSDSGFSSSFAWWLLRLAYDCHRV